jgi:peptidoglycan/LPS O-acetylase OafA/YrhL
MKTLSPYWALVVGLLVIVAQVLMFYFRFGRWNTAAMFAEYLFFFLAGALGGSILVFFLNRQPSRSARWMVLVGFLIACPIALFMMIGGGLLGPFGVLAFPQIPWALFTWLGSIVGSFATKR